MSDTFLFAQTQPFSLSGAGSSIADETLVLTSFKTIDAVNLAMTDFGDIGYGTIEPNNGTSEEQISFSGVTQNANGTATLTGVKTVLFLSPYTESAGLVKSHIGGAKFVISNTSGFYNKMTGKTNDETITGLYTFTQFPVGPSEAPTTDYQMANKKYADDLAIAGSPVADLTTKGIVEEATAAEINAGTQAGGTLAELFVNSKYLKDSEYYTLRPTTDEKAALDGSGTPSAANKFVTADTNALNELLSNKDTTGTLGTSDTKYPSQKAVKTYVDTQDGKQQRSSGITTGTAISDTATSDTVITHGLSVVPKIINIMCKARAKSFSHGYAHTDGVSTITAQNCFALLRNDVAIVEENADKIATATISGTTSATITAVSATTFTITFASAGYSGNAGTPIFIWEAFA